MRRRGSHTEFAGPVRIRTAPRRGARRPIAAAVKRIPYHMVALAAWTVGGCMPGTTVRASPAQAVESASDAIEGSLRELSAR